MSLKTDPAALEGLAGELESAAGQPPLPPAPDAGPSTTGITATLATLTRCLAGYAEGTTRSAADLRNNAATYASTENANTGQFAGHIG